jgi:hypothetical protein
MARPAAVRAVRRAVASVHDRDADGAGTRNRQRARSADNRRRVIRWWLRSSLRRPRQSDLVNHQTGCVVGAQAKGRCIVSRRGDDIGAERPVLGTLRRSPLRRFEIVVAQGGDPGQTGG